MPTAKTAVGEAVGKVPGGWKYTLQKKGRDKALEALIRPLKGPYKALKGLIYKALNGLRELLRPLRNP